MEKIRGRGSEVVNDGGGVMSDCEVKVAPKGGGVVSETSLRS